LKINKQHKYKGIYVEEASDKHQIVIGHSYSSDMGYIDRWGIVLGGNTKYTVPYSIDKDGTIYEHYDPINTSSTFNDKFDKYLININLVNEGWLDETAGGELLNVHKTIYNKDGGVTKVLWRNKEIWANYTEDQFNALVFLVNKLCDTFNIPKRVIGHNTTTKNVEQLNGVVYKSNYNELYTDISPAFDFDRFKKTISKL